MEERAVEYADLDVKETMDKFEDEICDTCYELDLDDEDTQIEIRRCLETNLEKLSTTGPLNPANPLYCEVKECEETPGGKCGLYHCMCHEEDREWYTGQCSYCEEFIESKKHAKRIPHYYGGFKGCYCSNKCLHECLSENTSAIEHVLIELMQYFQNIIDAYEEEDFNDRNDCLYVEPYEEEHELEYSSSDEEYDI